MRRTSRGCNGISGRLLVNLFNKRNGHRGFSGDRRPDPPERKSIWTTKHIRRWTTPFVCSQRRRTAEHHGCIVNSFHQVTSSFPPKFTVAVNKDHETCKAVQAAGSFSVTLLDADAPGEMIDLFGYKSGRVTDKFAGRAAETDSNGNPYLKEHMVSRIACKVVDQMEIGSFLLFVGQATEAEVLGDGRVLTLQAYTDRGKATPPTATVYRTVEINGYRCTVCGYVYEGESLPPDFRCPLCHAPAEKFVKIEK